MQGKKIKVEIEYFTDPLCCWSWAFEPQWRKLRYEYQGQIRWKYRMAGLLSDWQVYNDPMNSVSKPAQMGPVWKEAQHISDMPINDRIWFENPPRSSYPACMAVKTAELQGVRAGELYLRKAREAVMTDMQDISNSDVLIQLAADVAAKHNNLIDTQKFKKDLLSRAALSDFKKDLKLVKHLGISRYPSMTFKVKGRKGVMITGYRPYKVLTQALQAISPNIRPTKKVTDPEDYLKFWGSVTEREMNEVELSMTEMNLR